jgi:hypothetical protein
VGDEANEKAAAGRLEQRLALLASLAVAALAAWRLWEAYPRIENRLSFGWDAARRAVLNLEAAEALRGLHPLDLLRLLAGPETWPTLRMLFAAPALAFTGPSPAVESAVTVLHYALLLVAVAWAARVLVPREPLAAVAVAALVTAAHAGLLGYAATGMLEVLSALCTAAALAAWLRFREGGPDARVWPLALLGNCLFHAKWQHGLLFAAAALAVEAGSLPREARRAALSALGRSLVRVLRRRTAQGLLLAVAALALLAIAASLTGGWELRLAGQEVRLRDAAGPSFWAAFLLFYGAALGAWGERAALRDGIPRPLRALAVWLAGPMVAWTLVPFTWRLRTILFTAAGYQSHVVVPPGPLGGLRFYLSALLRDGYDRPARAAVALGLAAALTAAVRVPAARRRLAPLLALAGLELCALGLGSRANFQARFALNLVPVVALLCAAPLQLLPGLGRLALSLPLVALLAASAGALWSGARLPKALEPGFAAVAVQNACVTLSGLVPPVRGALVNGAPDPWRQDCAMDLFFEARKQGIRLDVHRGRPRRGDSEALDLSVGCRPPPPELAGFEPAGPPAEVGELCAQRYERRDGL